MRLLPLPVLMLFCVTTLGSTLVQRNELSRTVPAPVAEGKIAPTGRLAATNRLRLAISLPLRNQEALTNLIEEIYHRSGTNFHRYLTPAQFAERFGPSESDYETLKAFARSNGLAITATHPNRLLLDVTGAVADVEKALHVRMQVYPHPAEHRDFYAPDAEPTLDLAVPVLQVSGLDNYSRPQAAHHLIKARNPGGAAANDGTGTNGTIYGSQFRAAYAPNTPWQGAGQSVGLLEFDGYATPDITAFEMQNSYPSPGVTLTNVLVDNFDGSTNGSETEVSLDIEVAMAMAPGLSSILVYEAGPNGAWPDILNRMATDNLASQLSCSWYAAGSPADPACEAIFLEMAAQGQSFFTASGDYDAFTGLISFPDDNPYLTIVGGTTLYQGTAGAWTGETVWNWGDGYGSGGGISTQYPIPSWQAGINMAACQGSTTMRNVPDVALTADNVAVWVDGGVSVVGGTSCAAPLWAGFLALANEQGAQSGQPPMGFLNPALYAIAANNSNNNAFHDIVTGNNTSSNSPANFYAVPGYDLCTGLGTPDGTNLINALTTPDDLGVSPGYVFSSGQMGGPFSPTNWVVTLTNTGSSNLNWSVTGVPAWLAVSVTNGTLPANGSTNIPLKLQGARALPFGIYNAQMLVKNANAPAAQSLAVNLNIRQSLVQNGGFETGDFTGWTLVGDSVEPNGVYNSPENNSFLGVVHSGVYGALLGQSGYLATITQTLPTLPNQMYLVSFWVDNPDEAYGQEFAARWNGTNLMDLLYPPSLEWTNCRFVVTAATAASSLQFAARNDNAYFGLDDVTVFPVPAVEFTRVSAAGGNLQLAWNSLAGLNYEIQSTTNLVPSSWQYLAGITASTNTTTFVDTNAISAGNRRYYRLVWVP